jgi:hypothetical protein
MILSHKNCIFNEFNDWVIEQLDHIMVEDNLFYSGYSRLDLEIKFTKSIQILKNIF